MFLLRKEKKRLSSPPSIFLIFLWKYESISVTPALYSTQAEQSNQGIIQMHQFSSIMRATRVPRPPKSPTMHCIATGT